MLSVLARTSLGIESHNVCQVYLYKSLTLFVVRTYRYTCYGCTSLHTLVLGSKATYIQDYAFKNTKALTSVSFPSTVKQLGTSVFDTSGLTSVFIPAHLISIGQFCFYRCTSLACVNFEDRKKATVGALAMSFPIVTRDNAVRHVSLQLHDFLASNIS